MNTSNCAQINSFSTGHAKVYGIDINVNGTKMLTCGDDKTFKVWNISTSAILTSTPPYLGGGFDAGEVVMSCKFSSQDYVIIGLNSVNKVKVYTTSYNTSTALIDKTFTPAGKALDINFYQCSNNNFIMGSDNGELYSSNSTSSFASTDTSHVHIALVDRTNQFFAFGLENYKLYLV